MYKNLLMELLIIFFALLIIHAFYNEKFIEGLGEIAAHNMATIEATRTTKLSEFQAGVDSLGPSFNRLSDLIEVMTERHDELKAENDKATATTNAEISTLDGEFDDLGLK